MRALLALLLLSGCQGTAHLLIALTQPAGATLDQATFALDRLRVDRCDGEAPTQLRIGDLLGETDLLDPIEENLPAGELCALTLGLDHPQPENLRLIGQTDGGTPFALAAAAASPTLSTRVTLERGSTHVLLLDGDALLYDLVADPNASAIEATADSPLGEALAARLETSLWWGTPAGAADTFGPAWTTIAPADPPADPEEERSGCDRGADTAPTDEDTGAPPSSTGCACDRDEGDDTGASSGSGRHGCDGGDDTGAGLIPLLGLLAFRRRPAHPPA